MAESTLPTGRFGRLARLARVGASTGASLVLSRDGERAAQLAAGVLGEMRGLAAKVGQMASYVDGMVPEPHRDAYEKAMRSLQASAPHSPTSAIRATIEAELGAPIGALFASFEDAPFASASIGQVHRARLADGRDVAVKVQHPGIERAITNDLANASVLKSMVSTLAPREMDVNGVFGEIRARFMEELDYEAEAANAEAFAAHNAGDPSIVVPAVVRERSSRRVLTTELVVGETLDEAACRTEPERRRHAEVLWRFVFRSVLVHRKFNADPHPGNYVFLPGGRVAFLDYGCVQPIPPDNNRFALAVHRAALDRDEEAFRAGARAFLATRGGPFEAAIVGYMREMFEPLFADRFHITRQTVIRLVEGIQGLKRFALQRKSGFVPLRPGMLFMNRLQFGFFSVLARLDVEVSYNAIEEDILRASGLRRP